MQEIPKSINLGITSMAEIQFLHDTLQYYYNGNKMLTLVLTVTGKLALRSVR